MAKKRRASTKVEATPVEPEIEDDESMEDDVVQQSDEEKSVDRDEEIEEEDEEQEEEEATTFTSAADRFDDSSSEGEDSDDEENPAESAPRSKFAKVGTAREFEPDLGHMTVFNGMPVDPKSIEQGKSAKLRELTLGNAKLMFRDLLALPGVEGSMTIKELPKPAFRLPRHKPVPKARPETRWEKFAKDKDIRNRKRDRMVWNDETQTWAPRWGYGRHDEQNQWVVELDAKDDDKVDKFSEKRQDKKMRVLKNRAKFLRNKAEAAGVSPHDVENLSMDGARAGASKRGKDKVTKALKVAQVSTASLGRFDRVMDGEGKRELGSKRRKFMPTEQLDDVARDKKILSRLLGKHIGDSSGEPVAATKGKKGKKRR